VLLVWNALLGLLWPLMYLYRPFRGTVPQRLGRDVPDWRDGGGTVADATRILINAVSAGEVAAVAPVIRELRKRLPDCRIALLTTTDSGQEMARARLAGLLDWQGYFPLLDLPWVSRRYLDCLQPDVYITTESELWPNIMSQCQRRGIPVVSLNARVYLHNKRGWRLHMAQYLYSLVDLLICQTEEQRARFVTLGVESEKLVVSGNIKFDLDLPEWTSEQLAAWRDEVGVGSAPVIVAGSTHEGEEQMILSALTLLHTEKPPTLVLAPRHVERATEVARLAEGYGWKTRLLSQPLAGDPAVVVADKYGVLTDLYRLADIVVMGGTLHEKVGGHNLLEATALGRAVLAGPHVFSIQAQVELLQAAGGIARCHATPVAIAEALRDLLVAPKEAARIGEAALQATRANRGAAALAAGLILQLIGGTNAAATPHSL
jgi:3-deoxy-D-manno-octulosonic-acid transferase